MDWRRPGASPAAIFLVTGPSGAGKDTLLIGAREALAAVNDTSVRFVRRHLTREEVTDIEVAVTPEEFSSASASGEYALEWSAHQTQYAIPKSDLEAGIAAGQHLVLNVSRSIVEQVAARAAVGPNLLAMLSSTSKACTQLTL
jgi:phosphonate metabolism protein PhnN/1,5-bisphosphokinase (PRPP-forming)